MGDSVNRNLPKSRFIEPGRNLLISVGTVIDYFLRVAERLLAQTDGTTVVGHARGFRVAGDATQMVSHDSRRNLGRWVKSGCHRGEARFVLVHTQSVSLISLVYDLAAQMPLGPVLTALTRGHWSAVAVCSQPDDAFPLYCEKVHTYWNCDVHHKIKAAHPTRLDIPEKEQFVEVCATVYLVFDTIRIATSAYKLGTSNVFFDNHFYK